MKSLYADDMLLERLRERDRQTQAEVWQLEQPRLQRGARAILGSTDNAQPLVADVLVDFLYHYVHHVRDP